MMMVLLALVVVPLPGQQTPTPAGKKEQKAGRKAPDVFVLVGTVFTEQGFSLPGADIRVRRAGEKKVRRETQSDRRGEFAVHLPPGGDYELTVEAKGYRPQAQKFSAQLGSASNFVFRLQPVPKGEQP